MSEAELMEIVTAAERYNGAGRDTVLRLIAEVRHLRKLLQNKAKQEKTHI
jgi:hypothetical protein